MWFVLTYRRVSKKCINKRESLLNIYQVIDKRKRDIVPGWVWRLGDLNVRCQSNPVRKVLAGVPCPAHLHVSVLWWAAGWLDLPTTWRTVWPGLPALITLPPHPLPSPPTSRPPAPLLHPLHRPIIHQILKVLSADDFVASRSVKRSVVTWCPHFTTAMTLYSTTPPHHPTTCQ